MVGNRKCVTVECNMGPRCCLGNDPHLMQSGGRKEREEAGGIIVNLLEKSKFRRDGDVVNCKQAGANDGFGWALRVG